MVDILHGQFLAKPLADATRADIQWLVYKFAKANVDDIWGVIESILPVGGDFVEAIVGYALNWLANRYLGPGLVRDIIVAIAAALYEDATDKIFEGISSVTVKQILAAIAR